MAGWNGSGTFTFPYSWTADAAAGIDITASRMDTQFAYVSSQGFGNTITRDGQGSASANQPMNGFKHTGAGAASASGEYVVYQQLTGSGALDIHAATVTTTGTVAVGGALSVTGGSVFSSAVNVTAGGVSILTGGLTVTSGGATITAGGLVVVAGGAGIAGGLTVTTGGLIVSTGTISLSPSSGNVAISPAAGNVVINPGTAGTIDRMVIGGTVAAAGTFTTLIANNGTTGSQVVNYSQFPATAAATGTMTFPNGVIEKWGTGTTSAGTVAISFASAFPTACDNVQLTISGGVGTGSLNALFLGAISASQFTVWGPAASSNAFHWRAIGR